MSKKTIIAAVLTLFLTACAGIEFKKSPVDTLIRDMENTKEFSIILYDMDTQGTFATTYLHKYKIVTIEDSIPQEKTTDWVEVSKSEFEENMNNMGMEIVSKNADGKLNKTAGPPGYGNYVGNERYGRWNTGSDGSSFWEFYGKYAMFSTIFNMANPARRSYYDEYRGGYYGRKPYYGTGTDGKSVFGTNGKFNESRKSSSTWFSKASNQSFKDRVSRRVSRSSGTRSTRSSSRYSGKSFRSRGGGFGK